MTDNRSSDTSDYEPDFFSNRYQAQLTGLVREKFIDGTGQYSPHLSLLSAIVSKLAYETI